MSKEIKITLNEGLYIKDPQDSKLGRKIVENSILMIAEYGFESFTFKKLATNIGSTEASIYRYFENKHMLLLFLLNWYWEWVSYLITINTTNVTDPLKKLRIIINTFVVASKENSSVEFINRSTLHDIVITEGVKAYHSKNVDVENSKGFYLSYKKVVAIVAEIVKEINPRFKYPHALASNLFEMSNNHIYFAKHLPRLTNIKTEVSQEEEVEEMINYFVDKLLE